MRIVVALSLVGRGDTVDAQIAFHLAAGADLILAPAAGDPSTAEVLRHWERAGFLKLVTQQENGHWTESTAVAALLATEQGADWLIMVGADEFWWPRGESFYDVLIAIPERYGIVQGLVRELVPQRAGGARPEERSALRISGGRPPQRLDPASSLLRPMYRVRPMLLANAAPDDVLVPLRSWYPIEVFRLPPATAPVLSEAAVEEGRENGVLVADERLRDCLVALRSDQDGGTSRYVAPPGVPAGLFSAPSIVDDASYAADCAQVGEVDLEGLERQIRELQRRLAVLEHPFWPRVRRRVAGLVRR